METSNLLQTTKDSIRSIFFLITTLTIFIPFVSWVLSLNLDQPNKNHFIIFAILYMIAMALMGDILANNRKILIWVLTKKIKKSETEIEKNNNKRASGRRDSTKKALKTFELRQELLYMYAVLDELQKNKSQTLAYEPGFVLLYVVYHVFSFDDHFPTHSFCIRIQKLVWVKTNRPLHHLEHCDVAFGVANRDRSVECQPFFFDCSFERVCFVGNNMEVFYLSVKLV